MDLQVAYVLEGNFEIKTKKKNQYNLFCLISQKKKKKKKICQVIGT